MWELKGLFLWANSELSSSVPLCCPGTRLSEQSNAHTARTLSALHSVCFLPLSTRQKLLCKAQHKLRLLRAFSVCTSFSGQRLLCHPRATSCTRVLPDPEFRSGCASQYFPTWSRALCVPPCGIAQVSHVPCDSGQCTLIFCYGTY